MKNNKGYTQLDIVVSIIIIMIFSSVIGMLFYNSYLSSNLNKKSAEALSYLTQMLEKVDYVDYDNLENELIDEINKIDEKKLSARFIDENKQLETPYKADVKINNYNEGNDKKDIIKIVTIKVYYEANNIQKEIEAQRLKTR